jgi:hypothetical protein
MNKLATLLGIVDIVFVLATAPMPLTVNLENPPQTVTIYPNLLFAVPLTLLGALLLLYGAVAGKSEPSGRPAFD